MELKNCIECGKVFVHPSRDLCPVCNEQEELDFKKVKEYLWNKALSSVDEVHEMTGVDTKKIVKFIRTGRIGASGLDVELYLSCEGCGAPITKGRFCLECRDRIIDGLSEGVKERAQEAAIAEQVKPKPSSAKMYTAERYKRR